MSFDLGKLGVKRNVPRVNFTEYSGIISAPAKFGKTTLASMYPKSILLAFEKGYKAQSVNVKDINEWDDFVEFIDLLEEHRDEIGDSIQTITIDTVNMAYAMAEPYMLRKESIKDGKRYTKKEDIPYGQGWGRHDKYFEEQIQRIYSLGFQPTYITHMEIKTVRPKDGEEYDVYKTTMPDRLANIIFPECDYIIYGDRITLKDENGEPVTKRRITTRGNEVIQAGNRVYLEEDIIFDNEKEAMDKFQKLFTESIKRNLANAGVNKDFEELKAEQAEERKAEVETTIKNISSTEVNKELFEAFNEKFKTAATDDKAKAMAFMKENEINVDKLKDYESMDTEQFKELVELLG